jgi:glucokinase
MDLKAQIRHWSFAVSGLIPNLAAKMPKAEVVIGIDIGATNSKAGFVDREGNVLAFESFSTHSDESYSTFLDTLVETIQKLRGGLDREVEFKGIGVGAPNANPNTGKMESPVNFRWQENVPLADSIKEKFGLPVFITNDANAAAIGEMVYGKAMGMKNFILLTLGTGLGSGIVVDGKLLEGAHGLAGEMGHINAKPFGRRCNCGKDGCLETYVSATGIKRTVFKLMADTPYDSPLRSYSYKDMTGEMITEAALKGDRIACETFSYTGDILGQMLADTIALFDPEAVILAGGLTKAGDLLLIPTRDTMEKYLFRAYKNRVQLLISDMKTANAAVLGAAVFARERLNHDYEGEKLKS